MKFRKRIFNLFKETSVVIVRMVPVRPAVFFLDVPKVYVKPSLTPSCKN